MRWKKFMTCNYRYEVKHDHFDERAFLFINKCQSFLKVTSLSFLTSILRILSIVDRSGAGERANGKYQFPSGVPVKTEEENSNTETVRSSEPTNLPTQVVDGALDSDSIIGTNDIQHKKRKYFSPTASSRKKRACFAYKVGETIENVLYEIFSAAKLNAMQRNASSETTLYQKCLEDLQQLEELDDTEFTKAVNVLRDDKNAIAFMTIKGPRRLTWLRSLWQV
jgi:hypothetical protein